MPRTTKDRDPWGERYVAQRVAFERERREWTYEGLAKRMASAGCEMHASALYKIEKGDPPRRITVTELLAFAQVFEMPLAEIVADPETYLPRRIFELVDRAARLDRKSKRLLSEGADLGVESWLALREARELLLGHPEQTAAAGELIARVSDAEQASDCPTGSFKPRSLADLWAETSSPFEEHHVIAFASIYRTFRQRGVPDRTAMVKTLEQGGWTAEQGAGLLAAAQVQGFIEEETEEQA